MEQKRRVKTAIILEIQGLAWDTTTLNILVMPPGNVSWWNSSFLDSAFRAIGQWNEAISDFASNYSQYGYLSNLKLQYTVSNQVIPGFDIYLNWTESPLANTSNEIGLEVSNSQNNIFINATISLAAHASHGEPLTDEDMQNIALHELGHSLGLGHTNSSSDVMYPDYTLLSPLRLISTLDVFGVAHVFAWMQYSFNFNPVSDWLPNNPVTLPPNIPYKSLPVSSQFAVPQTLADNPVIETLTLIYELLIHPEIAAIVVTFIIILVIVALFPKRKSKAAHKGNKIFKTTRLQRVI